MGGVVDFIIQPRRKQSSHRKANSTLHNSMPNLQRSWYVYFFLARAVNTYRLRVYGVYGEEDASQGRELHLFEYTFMADSGEEKRCHSVQ